MLAIGVHRNHGGHLMISPTGKGVRGTDEWGSGTFGSPRGNRKHAGVDFISVHGQDIVAPCAGVVKRQAWPYADCKELTGLVIVSDDFRYLVKLFYVFPAMGVVGNRVAQGEVIGTAQDLEKGLRKNHLYPGIVNHVHMEVRLADGGELVNPMSLIKPEQEGA